MSIERGRRCCVCFVLVWNVVLRARANYISYQKVWMYDGSKKKQGGGVSPQLFFPQPTEYLKSCKAQNNWYLIFFVPSFQPIVLYYT